MTATPERRLLIATTNRGKLAELERLLGSISGLTVVGPGDVGPLPEVIEDGDTFEANAVKKAREVARATGLLTLADDSGLEVDALAGVPGVRSARYAGPNATDEDNNDKLLAALAGLEGGLRRARFRCVLAVVDPERAQREVLLTQGTVEGAIANAPRGQGGFGYDPLFVVEGGSERGVDLHHPAALSGKTMAELGAAEKNRISHRAHAALAMRDALTTWLG